MWLEACILKSVLLESIPNGKGCPICTSWGNSVWTPTYTVEMWSKRSARILRLDSLPVPVPWTSTAWGAPLSAVTQPTLLKLCFCFFTYRESHWDQTHPLPHGIKINNMKTTFLVPDEHAPSLFTLMLPLPSHLSWSLIMSCLVVFDFWVLNKLV